ncbi:MAG: DUF1624 domain-containing protein [Candidatus Hodarchaeales archaeon]
MDETDNQNENGSLNYFKYNSSLLKIDGINIEKFCYYIGFSLIFALLLILVSIITYPGGLDITAEFVGNLNGIQSITNRERNNWPRILFFVATLLMSIFGILFFIIIKRKLISSSKNDFERRLALLGSYSGIGVILILSEVFLIPYDRLLFDSAINSLLIIVGILLLMTTMGTYSILMIRDKKTSKYVTIFTIIIGLASILLFLLYIIFIVEIILILESVIIMLINFIAISFFLWIIFSSFYLRMEFNVITQIVPVTDRPSVPHVTKSSRLFGLDSLRGLIIILMALDHANHFIAHQHPSGEYYSSLPVYPETFDGLLAFLTRFVTHLCAPGFFFLMGIGMVLFANSRRNKDWSEYRIIKHFWIRGGLLIIIQLFVINQMWEMHPEGFFPWPYFGVLYALGGAMIIGSLLLKIPAKYLIIIALLFVFLTEINSDGSLGPLVSNPTPYYPLTNTISEVLLLFIAGGNDVIWVNYPVLPWMEVLILGFIFGKWLIDDRKRAYDRGLKLGIGFLGIFFVLRLLNDFGNTFPMPSNFSLIDFFNVVKYPPSITFIMVTMGINLILLYGFSKIREDKQKFLKPLIVFGQVALFVYIFHLLLYAVVGLILTPNGTDLAFMYPLWIIGLIILYPVAKKYGQFKHSRAENSIIRFF